MRFDSDQWSDYVRGLADPSLEAAIEEQLATGNRRLEREAALWRRLAAVGHRDRERQVPEHAVRVAKAIGSLRRGDEEVPAASWWRRLAFTVAFDSLGQPAPAGVRSLETCGRHLVFEAERFTVDVRLERRAAADAGPDRGTGVAVDGQILRCRDDEQPVPRTPVLVLSGGDIVSSTLASPEGEFHARGLPEETLNLCLLVGREECIEVPLSLG